MARSNERSNQHPEMPRPNYSKPDQKDDGSAVLADLNSERGESRNDRAAKSPRKDTSKRDDTSAVLADLNEKPTEAPQEPSCDG